MILKTPFRGVIVRYLFICSGVTELMTFRLSEQIICNFGKHFQNNIIIYFGFSASFLLYFKEHLFLVGVLYPLMFSLFLLVWNSSKVIRTIFR